MLFRKLIWFAPLSLSACILSGEDDREPSKPAPPAWKGELAIAVKVIPDMKVGSEGRYADGRLDCPIRHYPYGDYFVCQHLVPPANGAPFDFAFTFDGKRDPSAPPVCLKNLEVTGLEVFRQDAATGFPGIKVATAVVDGLCVYRVTADAAPSGKDYCSFVGCSYVRPAAAEHLPGGS